MGQGQALPVCGHLQAEGHLEVCQLLPTFQDLGDLALEALFLLLSYHIPLPHTCCPGELGEEL